jgi:hypothetical protein
MKKIILSLVCAWSLVQASSQKVYFIYLQTESEQPFYVRVKDKVYHSGATGYLVLSNLRDTVQTFSIGFPGNKIPEQKFSMNMLSRDHGFLIKNFPEKGWGLFNLQSLAVQMPVADELRTETVVDPKKSEPTKFTELLAKAVDDSSLLKSPPPVSVKTEKTEVVVQPVNDRKVEESILEKPVETIVEGKKEETDQKQEQTMVEKIAVDSIKEQAEHVVEMQPVPESQYQKSEVKKRSENSTTEGFGLTFIDQYANGVSDTIRILIPNPAIKIEIPEIKEEKKFLEIKTDTASAGAMIPSVVTKTVLDSVTTQQMTKESENTKPLPKNNCKDLASEKDFKELKEKMSAGLDDEGRLNVAKKYFKLICFNTNQIKNLSVLFLSDEGKYRFFDIAYTYVIDLEHFGSLQSELKEEYYINRFRAMLK